MATDPNKALLVQQEALTNQIKANAPTNDNLDTRLTAAEATIVDHEDRIVVLETP